MAYTIPAAILARLRQQAENAGMPYATVLAQHVYDLQGLVEVLKSEVTRVQGGDPSTTSGQLADAARKLAEHEAELAAYQAEQQRAASS